MWKVKWKLLLRDQGLGFRVSQNEGYPFGGPHNENHNIFGSILGPNLHATTYTCLRERENSFEMLPCLRERENSFEMLPCGMSSVFAKEGLSP